jgi:putative nucleotidyltransferase with HDIG domain
VKYASEFVGNLGGVVKQMKLVGNDQLAAFLGNASRHEHNTAIAAMAGLMARALNLTAEKSVGVIGLAGLFHDIGLMELGLEEPEVHLAPGDLSPEKRALYETHPAVGAELLSKIKRFDPGVIQAVAQHHLRKDNTGFPTNGTFTHIHLCAEIIGICDEFDYALRRKRLNPALDVSQEMEKVFPSFSRQVVKVFNDTFLKRFKKPKTKSTGPAAAMPEGKPA